MRKVLAITVALMIAAVILSPAMGYSIQSAGNQSYTAQTGPKVNYTVSTGTPAHTLTLDMIPVRTTGAAAVQASRVPYSFQAGKAVPYSMKLETGVQAVPEGIQTPPGTARAGAATQPSTEVVEQPPVVENMTEAAPVVAPVNETPVVEAPANETPVAPVEETKFSIMGKVFDDANGNGAIDENETGLAGWTVDLEQPAGTMIANATTAEDGSYAFLGLNPGDYAVSEVVQMGWTLISPADGKYTVTITNTTVANLDFANQMLPVEAAPANVTAPENATVPENVTAPENATAPQ